MERVHNIHTIFTRLHPFLISSPLPLVCVLLSVFLCFSFGAYLFLSVFFFLVASSGPQNPQPRIRSSSEWQLSVPTLGEMLGAFYCSSGEPWGLGHFLVMRSDLASPSSPWPKLHGVITPSSSWQMSSPALAWRSLSVLPLASSGEPDFGFPTHNRALLVHSGAKSWPPLPGF
jgi:hypothetical protein